MRRYSKTLSSALLGIEGYLVAVEVDISGVTPFFITVGLPDAAVKESRERVQSAIANSGFTMPHGKVTINLAPADTRKEGPIFDLPIAVGILSASRQILIPPDNNTAMVGELSLEGKIRPVRGALPHALACRNAGIRSIIMAQENAPQSALVEGIDVYGVESLEEVVNLLNGSLAIPPTQVDIEKLFTQGAEDYPLDLSEVKGQEHAKRALEVAAAGGHNILFIGPPGSGKTMMARRLPSILPPMILEEALETTKIHSIAGTLPAGQPLLCQRPFRSPHHTISDAGMIGGGAVPRPGEISLSHHGVLFLDELPELERNVLEALRQPMEDGVVTISRAAANVSYPANFMLAASMNPCPCGFFGSPTRPCTCSLQQVARYRQRVSGPVLDRIDIHLEVPAVPFDKLSKEVSGEPSAEIRKRVAKARQVQLQRFKDNKGVYTNSQLSGKLLHKFCPLDEECKSLLARAVDKLGLSARAYDRITKLARTIADLAGEENITTQHISEAIQYRALDREL